MRILFVNSARIWGGNEKWTHLAAHSLAQNHYVHLAYCWQPLAERFAVPKTLVRLRSASDIASVRQLVGLIRRHQIDFVLPTRRVDYILAGVAARICGVKSIIRLGIVRPMGSKPWNRLTYGTLTDGIIVNARAIEETLRLSRWMRNKPIRIIRNGLDLVQLDGAGLNHSDPKDADAPRRVQPPFRVVAVGSLIPRKGFNVVIDAFARFCRDLDAEAAGRSLASERPVQLEILGDGHARRDLQAQALSAGVHDRVHFAGFVEDPYPHLSAANVFVLPSANEGISNALLEAMYCRCAVITTRAGGTEEVIHDGENGLLVDAQDALGIASALQKLYRDPIACRAMAERGRETVAREFSLLQMTEQIEQFAHSVLSGDTGSYHAGVGSGHEVGR